MAKRLSVAQLNGYIKNMFADELLLHDIEIFGEMRDFSLSGNNTFFTLGGGGCTVQCVKFGTLERFADGVKVLVYGTVTFFDKAGRVTVNAKSVTLMGESEEHLRLVKLKETLRAQGVFDKGLALPPYIGCAAVVTSVTGAVIHDINAVLKKNRSNIDIVVIHSKVQGGGADSEICAALDTVNALKDRFDCVIIARGGGSSPDLDIFNSERLARSVADCAVPVVSAVGHEVDFTLCDLCAKTRAGTPSIAAEMLCSVNKRFTDRFINAAVSVKRSVLAAYTAGGNRLYRVQNAVLKRLELNAVRAESRLNALVLRTGVNAKRQVELKVDALKRCAEAMDGAVERLVTVADERLKDCDAGLEKNSPLKILSKGYAKVMQNGRPVSDAKSVEKGEVTVLMSDGGFTAQVKDKTIKP